MTGVLIKKGNLDLETNAYRGIQCDNTGRILSTSQGTSEASKNKRVRDQILTALRRNQTANTLSLPPEL